MFRNTDAGSVLNLGQPDFLLKTHPEEMVNPNGVAEHNPLPNFWSDRQRAAEERLKVAEGLKDKAVWDLYHKKLPLGHVPLAQNLADRFIKSKEET